ncbi:cation:proton antiporter [Halocella sp. SP3-1]|uniref:cation:proton antiporter n=1 Tax=Halocella sp. SP3-1 TaxID=2382161 RepID=UPI000F75F64D|nr:cation:proton antiporter [Halocella sp. SP3-1]AZO93681.1 cation:proton antiporter [Halocella sp. SP3-1]
MDFEIDKLRDIGEWFVLNQASNKFIYVVGFLIFMALLVVLLSKKYRVPIVVGYVFLGMLFSHDVISALPFISPEQKEWYFFTLSNFEYMTNIALAFIAFTIGTELSVKMLRRLGKPIMFIAFIQCIAAFLVVTIAVLAIGKPLYLALILGAISSATAPAATVMVLKEYKAEGVLTAMIIAVIGIDDAIALIIFSLIEPIALTQYSGSGSLAISHLLGEPMIEIFASLFIGLIIGYLSQSLISTFEDSTKKILTLVTTIIGGSALALLLNLSPLITNMAVGFAFRNFARKNLGVGNYMDILTIPLYALFFILAGTEIRLASIASSSFLIIAFVYLISRVIGKVSGASLGAILGQAPDKVKKYIGLGLLPQSGVAIAMAYTVQQDFIAVPEVGLLVFNVLLFTAALTEVFGPFATKYAVVKAGEAHGLEEGVRKENA